MQLHQIFNSCPFNMNLNGGASRSRTGLRGFAIQCITALLSRHIAFQERTLNWSGKRDSNSRPQPWQGCALPTELFPLFRFKHCLMGWVFYICTGWCQLEFSIKHQLVVINSAGDYASLRTGQAARRYIIIDHNVKAVAMYNTA